MQGNSGAAFTYPYSTSSSNALRIYGNNGGGSWVERMRVKADGKVGIGRTSPSYPLHMGSGAHVTSGGVWTNASSRTLKENIHDLSLNDAVNTLAGLKPVVFNYKVEKGEQYVGFIAEDVPDMVAMERRKSLNPMDMVGILTRVVQEQQKVLEELGRNQQELLSEVQSLRK